MSKKPLKPVVFGAALKSDPVDDRDYKFNSIPDTQRVVKMSSSLPSQVSWREEMSPVKYQGKLGSCVGFATCALKEWQEKKEHEAEVAAGKVDRREDKEYNLSEQWVYWNAKKIDPWPGEEGTNFRSALKVLNKIGVPIEAAWPYSDDGLKIGEPKRWAHLIARWSTIDSYWRIDNSVVSIKRALAEGPILFGMTCFEEMYGNLAHGRIPMPAKPKDVWSYHAVLAVGFDDERKEICFKNSWSRFWGDEGYGYIPYDYVGPHCWDHWAVKDVSVTPEMLKGTRKLIE